MDGIVKHDSACQVKFDLVVRRQLAVYIEFFCTGQIYLLQLPGIGGNGELGRTEAECFIFSFRTDALGLLLLESWIYLRIQKKQNT